MTEIKVGQIWQEVDPRYPFLPHRKVKEILPDGRVVLGYREGSTRTTKSSASRFNGKRGGYQLIRDVQP